MKNLRENLNNALHDKGASFEGPEAVGMFRLQTIIRGLNLEAKTGMKLSRGRSCYAIAKQEFGLKGNKTAVLEQLIAIYKAKLEEIEGVEK